MYTRALPPAGGGRPPGPARAALSATPSARRARARSEDGVDERAERRGRGQHDQRSDEEETHDDRDQEPGAALNEEVEQLTDRADESQGHAPAPELVRRGRSIQKGRGLKSTSTIECGYATPRWKGTGWFGTRSRSDRRT